MDHSYASRPMCYYYIVTNTVFPPLEFCILMTVPANKSWWEIMLFDFQDEFIKILQLLYGAIYLSLSVSLSISLSVSLCPYLLWGPMWRGQVWLFQPTAPDKVSKNSIYHQTCNWVTFQNIPTSRHQVNSTGCQVQHRYLPQQSEPKLEICEQTKCCHCSKTLSLGVNFYRAIVTRTTPELYIQLLTC